jgi:hypothetical protein
VRKIIRSGVTEFRYEREEQPLPKIGRWRDTLDQLLLTNEAKAARERLTLIRLFEELRGRGYDGGYDAVRRYARRWAKEHGAATAGVYVPLSFAPGEAYQFDWIHEVVLLSVSQSFKSSGALHLADDWIERAVGVLWRAEVAEAPVGFHCDAFQKRRCET